MTQTTLNKATRAELRPQLLRIWRLNKKTANLRADRDCLIDELNSRYGKYVIDKAYTEFETGIY